MPLCGARGYCTLMGARSNSANALITETLRLDVGASSPIKDIPCVGFCFVERPKIHYLLESRKYVRNANGHAVDLCERALNLRGEKIHNPVAFLKRHLQKDGYRQR